jgi:hypothetical protein
MTTTMPPMGTGSRAGALMRFITACYLPLDAGVAPGRQTPMPF